MSVIAQLSIFPLHNRPGETGVSAYVARAVGIIRASGLPHVFGPMSTSLEGEYDEVMDVVGRCFRDMAADCDRVYVSLALDWRRGRSDGLDGKVRSVEDKA